MMASTDIAHPAPVVTASGGALRGRWDDGVASFVGIPYAAPPIGPLRWASPRPVEQWSGTRDVTEPGPIAPQHPARLTAAMGPMEAPPADEDCLTLNVWTPAPSPSASLPVLVFFHGGGYLAGAGSARWYEGAVMAARGPAVVVTTNFRLGALGYLYLPSGITGGDPVANLGLQDQQLALEWVKENIAAFGGDPARLTVFGQSGGGHSIVALRSAWPQADTFQRAILQSAPLGLGAAPADDAERITSIFLEALGEAGADLERLRRVPVDRILDAQRATLMRTGSFGRVDPPFHLVVDGTTLIEDPMSDPAAWLRDVDLMLGFTRDEMRAFYAPDDALWGIDADALLRTAEHARGAEWSDRLREYLATADGSSPAAALSDLVGDELIVGPTLRLADRRADAGDLTHLYRFGWRPSGERLGACHCIELPFVFHNFDAWTAAPMLGGHGPAELDPLGEAIQAAWLSFAATGDPRDALPSWSPYARDAATTVDFGESIALLEDPSDGRRERWVD
jgi:para-nitrobenzyl esterase